MNLPPKNAPIPIEGVIKICEEYGLIRQLRKIQEDPPKKPFVFDGASGLPERLSKLIDPAALPHDIDYWLGGTEEERLIADCNFCKRVITLCGRSYMEAEAAFNAVRIGGASWLPTPWHWGFGR